MSRHYRIVIAAALGCLPLTGIAGEPSSPFAWPYGEVGQRPVGRLADSSREERAKFRSELQRLPADEHEAIMQELRQQWREVPPEERYRQRDELMKRTRDRQDQDREQARRQPRWEDGYGQGFEARQWERPESVRPFERPEVGSGGRGRR